MRLDAWQRRRELEKAAGSRHDRYNLLTRASVSVLPTVGVVPIVGQGATLAVLGGLMASCASCASCASPGIGSELALLERAPIASASSQGVRGDQRN